MADKYNQDSYVEKGHLPHEVRAYSPSDEHIVTEHVIGHETEAGKSLHRGLKARHISMF